MREIRFRAFNKVKNCYWGSLSSVFFETSPQGIYSAEFIGGDGSSQTWSGEDLIFEQFTGLLDKNGKTIFEGDVVVVGQLGHEWTMVIEPLDDCINGPLYGVERFCNFSTTKDDEYVWEKNTKYEGRRYELPFLCKSRTVIGTIHDAEYRELAK